MGQLLRERDEHNRSAGVGLKCAEKARECRQQGNKLFAAKNFHGAADAYTKVHELSMRRSGYCGPGSLRVVLSFAAHEVTG